MLDCQCNGSVYIPVCSTDVYISEDGNFKWSESSELHQRTW